MVKLVVAEPESAALRAELDIHSEWLAATICATEVVRSVRRWSSAARENPTAAAKRLLFARQLMQSIALLDCDPLVFTAGELDPPELRSLDAIHLACALEIGGEIEGLVTYDTRLAGAAVAAGIRVLSPS